MIEISTDLAGSARPNAGDPPLLLHYQTTELRDLGAEMGLPPAETLTYRDCRNAVIIALSLSGSVIPEQWIRYSRDKNRYAAIRRYTSLAMTYGNLTAVMFELAAAGLIEERRMRPGRDVPYQSTIRITDYFKTSCPIQNISEIELIDCETVRLKDAEGRPLRYLETRETRAMRRDVDAQNEASMSLALLLTSPRWQQDKRGLWTDGRRALNPSNNRYRRIFNENFRSGGRWYGHWVQGLPATDRRCLFINGKPVVERDYPSLHPRLLAIAAGVDLAGHDPYHLTGFSRGLSKKAFNILLNARSRKSAIGALQLEFRTSGHPGTAAEAEGLLERLEQRHPEFCRFWGRGFGLYLQFIDSEMCAAVLAAMRANGVVAISVHDSFIAPETHQDRLDEAMDDAFQHAARRLLGRFGE